ncbi:MAG TPA: FAD-dependent oxidoreductase, partial [Chroococcales cyanobacterium]
MKEQSCFNQQQAVIEATRCLMCHDAPCQQGCPAKVDVPGFIRNIKTRNFEEANRTIKRSNVLSGACAKVCPVNEQCQERCSQSGLTKPIKIGRLQEFAASCEKKSEQVPVARTGKKVALVGGGPASLACAYELGKAGIEAVILERNELAGGMLTYGIPNFRLSKDLVGNEISFIERCGTRIETGKSLGKDYSLDDLLKDYDAVFLGLGASEPSPNEGKGLNGVVAAVDYLSDFNAGKLSCPEGTVMVVGGGNTAIDAATAAKALGAQVTILYRRTEAEMPAWKEEIARARAMGVNFLFLAAPSGLVGEKCVEAAIVRRMELGEPDESGRRRPVEISGSDFSVPCSLVIYAISQGTPSDLSELLPGIELTSKRLVKVDESFHTSHPRVFAGGDLVNGG